MFPELYDRPGTDIKHYVKPGSTFRVKEYMEELASSLEILLPLRYQIAQFGLGYDKNPTSPHYEKLEDKAPILLTMLRQHFAKYGVLWVPGFQFLTESK
jgi:hypothetical protein